MKHLLALPVLAALAFTAAAADYEKTVDDLIPMLGATNIGDRYAAQMDLQKVASESSRSGSEANRVALATVLALKIGDATVPQPARVWMIREIEWIGRGESVDALTQVMGSNDDELRESARRALEKNPDPRASASLRAALDKAADATSQIGLIHSLAQRLDENAVPLIAARLKDEAVGAAAALALGRIATPSAIVNLWGGYGRNPAVSEALIDAGNRLAAQGKNQRAKVIFQDLLGQEHSLPIRVAALVGIARTDPATAGEFITNSLLSQEIRLQDGAVKAAEIAYGPKSSKRLGALFPRLTPSAKVRVLAALDASAEKQVVQAVDDSDKSVRLAAVEALGRIGGAPSVGVLLKISAGGEDALRPVADTALASIAGAGAVPALERAVAGNDRQVRAAAIGALGAQNDTAAIPAILKAARGDDPMVKKAAFTALGQLGGDKEIQPVGRLALASKSGDAINALSGIAGRVKEKPVAAGELLALAAGSDDAVALLLDALSALGGKDALAAVSRLATNTSVEVQRDALGALGNWVDFSAAAPLLVVAADPQINPDLRSLAVGGIASLIKSCESEPKPPRVLAGLTALENAQTAREKKLVLSALGAVPSVKAAQPIKALLLGDPAVKAEAALAAVAVAEAIIKTDPAAARDLAEAVKASNVARPVANRADKVLGH